MESKDEMKKRGMKSPDKADALMLGFADAGVIDQSYLTKISTR
jgi:hypothetical protein